MSTASSTKFHLSLNVAHIARSVEFYQKLFGQAPAKHRPDYAKFELAEPPVVLSLEPHAASGGGTLNHLGLRLSDTEALVEMQRRLEMAGLSSEREHGVECCYARQTKFWLHDPDGNLWEFYVLEGDLEHRGAGQLDKQIAPADVLTPCAAAPKESPPTEWEHRLGDDFPAKLPLASGTLGEVRLRGTFNAAEIDTRAVLSEARRVLADGGRLVVHCLTAASSVNGALQLPGPAAVVKQVPVDRDLMHAVEEAGFVGVELTKFGGSPCFQFGGTEMRETMLRALKPDSAANSPTASTERIVLYRGPFRELTDDSGRTWRRGERQRISAAEWSSLQRYAGDGVFTCLAAESVTLVRCSAGQP